MNAPSDSRVVAEWDWIIGQRMHLLHAPEKWDDDDYNAMDETATTVCQPALARPMNIPGVLTRMGASRCKRCCRKTGMPQGVGSPKNDDACRPLVETRIAALRGQS